MDDDLIGQLLDAASGRLAAYGYLLTGSQHASQDLVQDAIVKVFVKRRRLDNVRAAEGYVRAAMRTIHLDDVRRVQSWRAKMPRLAPREQINDTSDDLATRDLVGRALALLPPQERAVVVLRHYDDLQIQDIAIAMRIAEGTVKRYLSQAHATLAATLGDIEAAPDVVPIMVRKVT